MPVRSALRHGLLALYCCLTFALVPVANANAESLDALAGRLGDALADRFPGQGVLVHPFVNVGDGAECGPISNKIVGVLHQAVINTGRLTVAAGGLGGEDDPVIIRGRFDVSPVNGVTIDIEAGRGSEKVFGGQATLAPPAPNTADAACIYTLEPDGRTYVTTRDIVARNAPLTGADPVVTFLAGDTILVEKRLRGSRWKIVQVENTEWTRESRRRVFVEAATGRDIVRP